MSTKVEQLREAAKKRRAEAGDPPKEKEDKRPEDNHDEGDK